PVPSQRRTDWQVSTQQREPEAPVPAAPAPAPEQPVPLGAFQRLLRWWRGE
ncbi:cytochrome P450, partial [Streptomyces sp. RP5T]